MLVQRLEDLLKIELTATKFSASTYFDDGLGESSDTDSSFVLDEDSGLHLLIAILQA